MRAEQQERVALGPGIISGKDIQEEKVAYISCCRRVFVSAKCHFMLPEVEGENNPLIVFATPLLVQSLFATVGFRRPG